MVVGETVFVHIIAFVAYEYIVHFQTRFRNLVSTAICFVYHIRVMAVIYSAAAAAAAISLGQSHPTWRSSSKIYSHHSCYLRHAKDPSCRGASPHSIQAAKVGRNKTASHERVPEAFAHSAGHHDRRIGTGPCSYQRRDPFVLVTPVHVGSYCFKVTYQSAGHLTNS
jgi:hypothetical protein